MERDYKHWKNCDVPGQTCYITCTCLDFAHLLHREKMRRRMALHILEATRVNKARLHAFVVMSHHFHLIVKPNDSQTNSQFMRSLKSYSAKDLIPRLNAFEHDQLKQQITLNQRKFWKASFRGFPIYSQKLSDQKMGYIHMNPARAGYVELPDDYAWSSRQLYNLGLCHEFDGLQIPESIQLLESIPY